MNFVGRITKDAVVQQLKDERKVVNFTVAINDYYKRKGQEMPVKTVLFVNCSYWMSIAIAERLTKGALVEISGRIYVSAYNGKDNEAMASLNCHANTIKIHSAKTNAKNEGVKEKEEVIENLPF